MVQPLTMLTQQSAGGAGTTHALVWSAVGIVGVVVLTVLVRWARRRLLGPTDSARDVDLADTIRQLRERGEISPKDYARVQQRLLDQSMPAKRAEPRSRPPRV